jgi:UDP-glucose 4-epimerase
MVTGGAGYIGSVIVEGLLSRGEQVVVLDSMVKGHRGAVLEGATLIEADLADTAAVGAALRAHAVDAVIHMAAHSLVGESVQQPGKYFANNVAHSITLANALIECGVRRLVFSSTAAVYGDPASTPIDETATLAPVNPYGESKLAFERMLPAYATAHGLRWTSLRYFNAAGATERLGEEHHPETHLIPIVLQVALGQRAQVDVYGTDYPTPDGTCIRDYIHVADLASAHVLALDALRAEGGASGVYNLGNGLGHSVREVIEAARRVTGHSIPTQEAPRRPGDPPVLVASSARISRELGWQPQHPDIEDIIRSAWQWHQRHPNGYGE